MSTKIDLDEIERMAREAQGGACFTGDGAVSVIAPSCPVTTLALIARIRELEGEIGAQADGAPTRRDRRGLIDLYEKGTVLP